MHQQHRSAARRVATEVALAKFIPECAILPPSSQTPIAGGCGSAAVSLDVAGCRWMAGLAGATEGSEGVKKWGCALRDRGDALA